MAQPGLQVDLSRLEPIFSSMQSSMDNQTRLLNTLVTSNTRASQDAARAARFAAVSSTVTATGEAIGSSAKGIGGGLGSILSGMGSLAKGGGIGLAAAVAALALIPDANKIKDSVETILSIGENYESRLDFFIQGGTLSAILFGLGFGLKQFAVGAGANVLVDWLAGYGGVEDWSGTVKKDVETLLTIGQDADIMDAARAAAITFGLKHLGLGLLAFGAGAGINAAVDYFNGDWAPGVKNSVETLLSINLGNGVLEGAASILKGGALTVVMGALGAGLIAFGTGSAITAAVDKFANADWAENVAKNVETLLSISKMEGVMWDATKFTATMGLIGAGLAAFTIGKTAEGASEGAQEALSLFTGQSGFAERVKSEVQTLLSISQLDGVGADTSKFVATMGGIGLGLAAFALGKGVEGLSEGAQEAIEAFTGQEPYAERIKSEVQTLLSITDIADEAKAKQFSSAMGTISAGIMKFGAADFVSSLMEASGSLIRFFAGTESPFDHVKNIYENADQLTQGADALDRLTGSLSRIGNLQFDGSKMGLKDFAEDLAESIPVIESAIMGGTIAKFGIFNDLKFKGLASPEIDYATAIQRMNDLRGALGIMAPAEAAPAPTGGGATVVPVAVPAGGGGGTVTNVVTNNTVITNPDASLDIFTLSGGGP